MNATAAVLVVQTVLIGAGAAIAADMHAHARTELLGGVNMWGYRGRVAPVKAANEVRLAAIGGDLAFGWGVAASETSIATVRQLAALEFDKPGGVLRRFTAVNLGAMGLAASRYADRLRQFIDLSPDVVCVLVDPSGERGRSWLPDESSAIARATGYVPMLPHVIEERGGAAPLALAARGFDWLDRALARGGSVRSDRPDESARGVAAAVRTALAGRAAVIVVLAPDRGPDDAALRRAISASVASLRAGDGVCVVDLGDAAEMYEEGTWLDGANLSAAGHARAAEQIAPAVIALLRQRGL